MQQIKEYLNVSSLVTQFHNFTFNYTNPSLSFQHVVECPADKSIMLLSLDVCNLHTSGITIDLLVYDVSKLENFYLAKQTPIPVGSTLQFIVKQKHILEPGDIVKIKPNFYNVDGTLNVVGASMEMYMSV